MWVRSVCKLLAVMGSVILCGCDLQTQQHSENVDNGSSDRLKVFAVNYPLSYFAQRIGADQVDVTLPVPPGQDPVHWFPDSETIVAMQGGDLVFLNGAGYEPWLDKVSLPRKLLVDTSAALAAGYIELSGVGSHSHGPDGAHSHRETAFTIWLNPLLAIEQARAVLDGLSSRRPELTQVFTHRFKALETDLKDLDRRMEALFAEVVKKPMLFSHPVYQYLVDRYGLKAKSLHWEPLEYPDQNEWQSLANLLEEHPAGWMVWEAEPSAENVAQLEQLGVRSLVFSPGANRPEQGDFLSLMLDNAGNIGRMVTQ